MISVVLPVQTDVDTMCIFIEKDDQTNWNKERNWTNPCLFEMQVLEEQSL